VCELLLTQVLDLASLLLVCPDFDALSARVTHAEQRLFVSRDVESLRDAPRQHAALTSDSRSAATSSLSTKLVELTRRARAHG
jgi:hypothetical protein